MIYAGICISWSGGDEFSMIYGKVLISWKGNWKYSMVYGKVLISWKGTAKTFHGIWKKSYIMEPSDKRDNRKKSVKMFDKAFRDSNH